MKTKSKILIVLASVALIICLIVGVDEILSANDFNYVIDTDTNTVTITGINTSRSAITIPKEINGKAVTAIGDYAFKDSASINSVTFPDTISYIGKGAFYNCSNLFMIYNLNYCIELKAIENDTFYNCKRLRKITLPDNLGVIGDSAFKSCHKLKKLTIPDSVSYIGKQAFDNCQSIKEFTIPQGITKIEEKAFFSCLSVESIALPEGLIEIGEAAFANCYELEAIAIPSTVETIGKQAFTTCKALSSITIPERVKIIGYSAFYDCTSLGNVVFENAESWLRMFAETDEKGTSISATDLADPAKAAEYLTSNYAAYYWHRTE